MSDAGASPEPAAEPAEVPDHASDSSKENSDESAKDSSEASAPAAENASDAEEDLSIDSDECPDYGSASYWDSRYTVCPQMFDWYQTWDDIMSIIAPFFDGSEIALNIGCGNSPMAVDMASTFKDVVNIDISSVVIDQMEADYSHLENIIWLQMDCMDLKFDDDMFDCAFDKGTIDALMCGDHSAENVRRTLSEAHRVLAPGGLFFEITYGTPDSRVPIFEAAGLDWKLHPAFTLENKDREGSVHYLYIFEKPLHLRSEQEEEEDRSV